MSMWTLVVAALHVSAHVHSLVQRQGEFVAWMACEELVEVHGLRAMLQPWVEVDAAAALVVRDALGLMGPCCIPWCFPLLPPRERGCVEVLCVEVNKAPWFHMWTYGHSSVCVARQYRNETAQVGLGNALIQQKR